MCRDGSALLAAAVLLCVLWSWFMSCLVCDRPLSAPSPPPGEANIVGTAIIGTPHAAPFLVFFFVITRVIFSFFYHHLSSTYYVRWYAMIMVRLIRFIVHSFVVVRDMVMVIVLFALDKNEEACDLVIS